MSDTPNQAPVPTTPPRPPVPLTPPPGSNPPPPRKRGGRGRWILIALIVLLIVVVVIHILHRKKPERGAAPQVVTVAPATTGSMPVTLDALGTVTPVATVTVLPQLSGYLTEVGYREGQDVVKGQFLAQIDPRQYEISKEQAEAQLAKDRASLAQARADLERYTQLNEKKSIAEQTYSDQKFLVAQDEAAVKSDLANIKQYELDLIYCRITAPVSGRVGLRLVDPGNYVTASSSTGIAVITTMKPTTVQFTVPQNSLSDVLQRVNAGAKLPITIFNSENTKQLATGTLYAISNQMATATGTVTLRASVPNDDEALFPNEFVNVRLLVDTLQNAVLVPTPAVQSGAPGDYVYLVNADNTVSVHKVTLGPSDGQHTVITAGLQAGQRVVTDGLDRLNDGAKIQPSTGKPATAKGASAARMGNASHARAVSAPAADTAASSASSASDAS
ncbi:multidrug efflux system membrane fusion protein [Paraburkholderia bannensis]|uniref:Multidrug efflux system membrane fusion protein n=1 Tax=Paraburkholderia bannensis TaxID=765414 RepID=A0A7W9U263_9BURK|nr:MULTISPECIES: efflux RND transporter periplasmic adaptor subunit [Paraburkholderia]MBB3260757.1 multidrug efflux system membrane fusion protein [Paraburkholderia sp. WP4_3_2]MBB6105662.1 multidrug efflux system membrane fusion protein [Paraburkholderia bannensis]